MQLKRYWVSWNEFEKDYRPIHDPPNSGVLGWWCSGRGDDHVTLCAWIQCESRAEITQVLGEDWPQPDGYFDMRFSKDVDNAWRPTDRFPLEDWMKERANAISAS